MKKLFLIFIIFTFLTSCDSYVKESDIPEINIITRFESTSIDRITRYYTTTYGIYSKNRKWTHTPGAQYKYAHISFTDSTGKYQIGDTIIFSKK